MKTCTKVKAQTAFNLRESGMKLRAIGKEIGTCGSRAGSLIEYHKRRMAADEAGELDLSNRSMYALRHLNIVNTRDSIRNAIESGLLNPAIKRIRNFGWAGYKELCEAVGLPDPTPIKRPRCCPNCGYTISAKREGA